MDAGGEPVLQRLQCRGRVGGGERIHETDQTLIRRCAQQSVHVVGRQRVAAKRQQLVEQWTLDYAEQFAASGA